MEISWKLGCVFTNLAVDLRVLPVKFVYFGPIVG